MPSTRYRQIILVIYNCWHVRCRIYNLSFQDPFITDKSLMQLFGGLPSGCIVLLRDVDSAGIQSRSNSLFAVLPSGGTPQLQQSSTKSTCGSNVTIARLLMSLMALLRVKVVFCFLQLRCSGSCSGKTWDCYRSRMLTICVS